MEEDYIKVTKAKLQALLDTYRICINSDIMTNKEAIEHVDKMDSIGRLLVDANRHYSETLKKTKPTIIHAKFF